jgi:acetyl-CoA carboxylase carboxyltransferase component
MAEEKNPSTHNEAPAAAASLDGRELFRQRRAEMLAGGGADRVAAQHSKGKLTARERLAALLDPGSFVEQQPYVQLRAADFGLDRRRTPGDGVVSGSGQVDSRQVFVAAQDFTVNGGSLGEMHAARIVAAQEGALTNRVPFIQVNDSGGARIQEGVLSLDGYARIFRANTHASGVIPQISVILGPCAGGAVYSPAITDFIFMVDAISNMFITGPQVIETVTGEKISGEDLGGAAAHCERSGVAHFRYATEAECLRGVRQLLSYLPASNSEIPQLVDTGDDVDRQTPEIRDLIPQDSRRSYDIKDVIGALVDRGSFLEVHAQFARNIVVGFARLAGRVIGIFANQPAVYAASLDIDSSDKGARFLRFCDSFNIPILSMVDVPGFLPGVAQEHGGIIRHGAKILYAIAEATVPKVALVLRKAYGGAFIAMAAKSLGYDRVLALPSAEVAVMGAEGAANVIFARDIKEAEDPAAMRAEKIAEFREAVMNPYISAGYGLIDDVIDPDLARPELIRSFEMNARKREVRPAKKHGNIPL